jgi:predicted AlkP superfamily pyrophosphatase or phosphodiesterase
MIRTLFALLLLAVAPAFVSSPALASPAPLTLQAWEKKPRLVLFVVFDQMRSDYLSRFSSRFLPAEQNGRLGGFRWLMSKGAYWPFAEYGILQSMTGPGHATLLSGSYPYQMGIPSNDWYDVQNKKRVYCVSDPDSTIVGAKGEKPGMSPRNFRGTTVGDEMKNSGLPSRVVSVALKDRAAILMGGHRADLAFWFDTSSYGWVTSRYYVKTGELPGWVQELNASIQKRKGQPYSWGGGKPTGLSNVPGDASWKKQVEIGSREAMASPFGVEVTVEAAERAMKEFKLGDGPATDLLAVSFSSHDYMAHGHGPNSREAEEMTVAEDRLLSRLLNSVSKQVPGGMRDVVVILSSDHGGPNDPDWLSQNGLAAERIPMEALLAELDGALTRKFGKPSAGKWFLHAEDYQFWFDPAAIAGSKRDRLEIETFAREFIRARPGMAEAITRTDVEHNTPPPGFTGQQAMHTWFAGRSGDVIAVPRPYHFQSGDFVTHMTGYAYDRQVPLIIAGPHFRPGVQATQARVIDIAPTLSFLLGVTAPATSEGRVLSEAIGAK